MDISWNCETNLDIPEQEVGKCETKTHVCTKAQLNACADI